MNESIFLVEREDYKAFVERLKVEAMEVKEEDEKYYIFEFPDDDEWGPPIPKRKITLETKEQVQLLFDFIRRKNND